MTDIDYSKNDFIDINNRLFRLGRNKMSENSIPLKKNLSTFCYFLLHKTVLQYIVLKSLA